MAIDYEAVAVDGKIEIVKRTAAEPGPAADLPIVVGVLMDGKSVPVKKAADRMVEDLRKHLIGVEFMTLKARERSDASYFVRVHKSGGKYASAHYSIKDKIGNCYGVGSDNVPITTSPVVVRIKELIGKDAEPEIRDILNRLFDKNRDLFNYSKGDAPYFTVEYIHGSHHVNNIGASVSDGFVGYYIEPADVAKTLERHVIGISAFCHVTAFRKENSDDLAEAGAVHTSPGFRTVGGLRDYWMRLRLEEFVIPEVVQELRDKKNAREAEREPDNEVVSRVIAVVIGDIEAALEQVDEPWLRLVILDRVRKRIKNGKLFAGVFSNVAGIPLMDHIIEKHRQKFGEAGLEGMEDDWHDEVDNWRTRMLDMPGYGHLWRH